MSKKVNKVKEKLSEILSEVPIETAPPVATVLDGIAVDFIKDGKQFKRVYVEYSLTTGEAKVVKVVDAGRTMSLAMQKTVKFITDKLLLKKKELI